MSWHEIEKDIKAIQGNAIVLERLSELLGSGEAIALVGAGASAEIWPTWDRFLKGFIEHSQKSGKITKVETKYFLKEASGKPLEIAQQLRTKIGDKIYFEYLQDTFCDNACPFTGGAYTRAHKSLLQLPVHNYLTLNYDAGLTNARAAVYPHATTSYFLWHQEEARRILDRGYKKLVLHAHGRHDVSDSIILTNDDYQKAYKNPAFVRLLDHLFAFEKLLIVGFGMSDPFIKQLFNYVNADHKKSPLRHIAFIGLDDKQKNVTSLIREGVENVYGAHVLFYPSRDKHKALTEWLTALVEKFAETPGSKKAEEIQPLTAPPQVKAVLADKYIHQPTDDVNFRGRALDFAILNRWGNDPATRTIAITGIGGQGKTSLVGRWLKQERSPELAQVPVFFWSFYEDLDVGKFLEKVVEFCRPLIPIYGPMLVEPISFLIQVVNKHRLLLVLDGLEVLQEAADSQQHGRINQPLLEQFLQHWLRYKHQGLMILTSRFRFPQLERFSGVSFHHLNLIRLSTEDGVTLLKQLGVLGKDELLTEYVEKLDGHPLALRVLASAVKRSCMSDLSQFNGEQILAADGEQDRLSQKLEHLLGFYDKQLKNGQKELLGIISLFKRPVETKSLITLLGKMKSLENTPLAKASTGDTEGQLNMLVDDFLVEKTNEGITTHPVIRDYFRRANRLTGCRREVADFLAARPGEEQPQTIEEVRDLVEAVQLLCDDEEFQAAHDLEASRLGAGGFGFDVFKNLPAVAEGLECEMAFVADKARRKQVEKVLGLEFVAAHCSGVGLYNYFLGNLPQALEWRSRSYEIRFQMQDKKQQGAGLLEISGIEMVAGNIRQAYVGILKAQNLLYETKDSDHIESGLSDKAYFEFLTGNSSRAYQDFATTLLYEQKRRPNEQYLYSYPGAEQAEFLIRLHKWDQFKAVNTWNHRNCEQYHWNNTLALCYVLQGWYEICHRNLTEAEKALLQAERILRSSGMVEHIARLDWVWGLLAEAKGDYVEGLRRVDDALFTCADKGFRLWQADLLVLRGRLYLMQFEKENQSDRNLLEKAGDDAFETLKIAEQTGYIWPKVEALELLAAYHQTRASLPAFNKQNELDSQKQYATEAQDIKKGLYLTEDQMAELKIQARKEFEQQTAGWDNAPAS